MAFYTTAKAMGLMNARRARRGHSWPDWCSLSADDTNFYFCRHCPSGGVLAKLELSPSKYLHDEMCLVPLAQAAEHHAREQASPDAVALGPAESAEDTPHLPGKPPE